MEVDVGSKNAECATIERRLTWKKEKDVEREHGNPRNPVLTLILN